MAAVSCLNSLSMLLILSIPGRLLPQADAKQCQAPETRSLVAPRGQGKDVVKEIKRIS
jgi:hypothetical protein